MVFTNIGPIVMLAYYCSTNTIAQMTFHILSLRVFFVCYCIYNIVLRKSTNSIQDEQIIFTAIKWNLNLIFEVVVVLEGFYYVPFIAI